jgi:hypothetical protein
MLENYMKKRDEKMNKKETTYVVELVELVVVL